MAQFLELGLDTFGDVTAGPDGKLLPHAQVIRNVMDEAILSDAVGIDFFGIGEHHRADFAAPPRKCCWPRSRRRSDTHPARLGRYRAQLG